MNAARSLISLFALASCLAGCSAFAEVDPATLYEISTAGSTQKVKPGEKGKWVLEITAKPGAHVSTEAPLKIELTGKDAQPEKQKLTLADSVAKKAPGQEYANPRFEVPFSTSAAKATIDAKVVFFICTDKVCARQQKNLSLNVEVGAGG